MTGNTQRQKYEPSCDSIWGGGWTHTLLWPQVAEGKEQGVDPASPPELMPGSSPGQQSGGER